MVRDMWDPVLLELRTFLSTHRFINCATLLIAAAGLFARQRNAWIEIYFSTSVYPYKFCQSALDIGLRVFLRLK